MCIKVGKCCCLDLRTGAIVIAVLGIVGSLGNLAFSTHWIIITEVITGLLVSFCLLFGAIKVNKIAVLIYLILNLLQIIFIFAVGIFFLVGGSALKVVFQDDGSTVDTLSKGISETGIINTEKKLTKEIEAYLTKDENVPEVYQNFFGAVGIGAIIGGVCIILWACLQIYFFICIHSFYKKIDEEGKKKKEKKKKEVKIDGKITLSA